jgi:hypothetical protein
MEANMNTKTEDMIINMDNAINKFYLEDDIFVFRSANVNIFSNWKIGDVKQCKTYLSATVDLGYAKNLITYFEDILIEIRVPAKTKCLYVGKNTGYGQDEREIILARNLCYKLIEKKKKKIILEIINN